MNTNKSNSVRAEEAMVTAMGLVVLGVVFAAVVTAIVFGFIYHPIITGVPVGLVTIWAVLSFALYKFDGQGGTQ